MVIRKNSPRSSLTGKLSRKVSRVDSLLSRLNNSILNSSGTSNHRERRAPIDLNSRAARNVRRAAQSGVNRFQLSRKQAIAQAASLFSRIGKRYL